LADGASRDAKAWRNTKTTSAVCETMRFVIAVQQRNPEEQQVFFERFVYPGAAAFCDALSALNQARFYRLVARFARAFFEIEKSAFEIAG
jgi:TorA maturation chaperone TorD